MASTSFIAVRDDARVISNNERDFIKNNSVRLDGRNETDIRNLSLELSRDENLATATIQWGSRVSTSVSATLTAPTERPNEGSLILSVDLSPGASTSFRQATPAGTKGSSQHNNLPPADRHQRLAANHILKCLERSLSDALDVEALCVIPASYVWALQIRTVVLDASGGNLLDACMVSCFAALRHYRKPVLDTTNGPVPRILPGTLKEPTPLPLHHTPFSISFALMDGNKKKLVDPSHREELCSSGELTVALNVHSEVCWLDFSGGCELDLLDLREANDLAVKHVVTISQQFEDALQQADQEFSVLQLAKIQQQQQELPPLPEPNVPFFVQESQPEIDDRAVLESTQEQEEEELYRKQALDYNLGHVAQKIRDDTVPNPPRNTSQLLAAMLQSVQQQSEASKQEKDTVDDKKHPLVESADIVDLQQQPPVVPAKPDEAIDAPLVQNAAPSSMVVDSDEEETTQLQSEFQSKKDDDDNVDDLAAAIKTKKKKKKKKK